MVYCTACGIELRSGADFCHRCGAQTPLAAIRRGARHVGFVAWSFVAYPSVNAACQVVGRFTREAGFVWEDALGLAISGIFVVLGILLYRGVRWARAASAWAIILTSLIVAGLVVQAALRSELWYLLLLAPALFFAGYGYRFLRSNDVTEYFKHRWGESAAGRV